MPSLDFSQLFSDENLRSVVWPWLLAVGAKALRFLLILALAAIAARVLGKLLENAVATLLDAADGNDAHGADEDRKRTSTIARVLRRAVVIAIWSTAVVMALSEIGFDIVPLIAGAGVAGVAFAFGAQHVIRDFLAGFFILIENQIRVGDVAVVNGTDGLVEEINLRTTVLRDIEGTVHVFPNGTIKTMSNKTRDFSFSVFEIRVTYKEDPDRVMERIRRTVASLRETPEFESAVLADAEVFGLDRFGGSALVIKGRVRTAPGRQWAVGREINRRLKKRFEKEGVEVS